MTARPEAQAREHIDQQLTDAGWLVQDRTAANIHAAPGVAELPAPYTEGDTLRARLQTLPPLITDGLWPPQITAIENLEQSLAANKPRALIQMATGSGKTFTAANFTYRLAKFGRAKASEMGDELTKYG